MSRRDDAEKLDALVRALFPDEEASTDGEVRAFLDTVGCDRERLRTSLREVAEQLAAKERRANVAPPPYLRSVIEACRDPWRLSQDPATATAEAQRWIATFQVPQPPPASIAFEQAFRGGDATPTDADERVLDELREDLRQELLGEKDEPDRE